MLKLRVVCFCCAALVVLASTSTSTSTMALGERNYGQMGDAARIFEDVFDRYYDLCHFRGRHIFSQRRKSGRREIDEDVDEYKIYALEYDYSNVFLNFDWESLDTYGEGSPDDIEFILKTRESFRFTRFLFVKSRINEVMKILNKLVRSNNFAVRCSAATAQLELYHFCSNESAPSACNDFRKYEIGEAKFRQYCDVVSKDIRGNIFDVMIILTFWASDSRFHCREVLHFADLLFSSFRHYVSLRFVPKYLSDDRVIIAQGTNLYRTLYALNPNFYYEYEVILAMHQSKTK